MQALPRGGAMVSIAASEAEVAEAVGAQAGRVSIAAVNGPLSVVISGAEADVLAVSEGFEAKGAPTKRLTVSHAFHSALMEPMLEEFGRVAESIAYGPARIEVVSNVSGKVAGGELSTAEYWVRHVREAVRFADGIGALHAAGVTEYLEIGPTPTLLGLVPGCLPSGAKEPVLVASLRPERAEAVTVLEALGAHYAQGGRLKWEGVFPDGGARVELPTLSVAAAAVLGRGFGAAWPGRGSDGSSAAGGAGIAGWRGGGLRDGAVAGGAWLALRSSCRRSGAHAGKRTRRAGAGGRRAPL